MGMGSAAGRLPYEFSCPCGARIRVDPMTKERRMLCPRCRKPVDFMVDFDTKRRTIQVSAVIPRNTGGAPPTGASAPSGESGPGKPAGRTVRGVVARCSCGTGFPIDERHLDDIQSCPGCSCGYHVVVKTEGAGKKRVAILVPQKPIVHRDEIIRATIYRKRPGSEGAPDPTPAPERPENPPSPPIIVVRKSRTRTVVPKNSKVEPAGPLPAPEVPPGAQAVPCSCGATFIVRRKDLGQELTCSRCGRSASFEELRDPQTLTPTIRIKAPPIG
jgi:hypothetical protein